MRRKYPKAMLCALSFSVLRASWWAVWDVWEMVQVEMVGVGRYLVERVAVEVVDRQDRDVSKMVTEVVSPK